MSQVSLFVLETCASHTPGLHNKIPAYNIFARGWVAQEPICS